MDRGNLSQHLGHNFPDVVVSTFSTPDWDFTRERDRSEFLKLVRKERPHFVFMAPPCTKWSPIQQMNARTSRQKKELMDERDQEEKSHLKLVREVFDIGGHEDIPAGMEHPALAASWETETMKTMKGYYEAVCHRCRTGLEAVDDEGRRGKVKKPTKIRTKSRGVAEAMDLPCLCKEKHVQMMGRGKELKEMQNYEEGFVKILAQAIVRNYGGRRNE